MDLQVLVSTMHQKNNDLLKKMNIQSDAIIINQCDNNEYKEFKYQDYDIKFLSFKERGIGLSRNNALMRATADICLFADDDVTYSDDYKKIIIDTFKENSSADVIVFNVPCTNPKRPEYVIPRKKRLSYYNCMRYGAFRVAVRTESVRKNNIYFSLLFGGGSKYGSGEDTLFLIECLKKGLKLYASPKQIGVVTHNESTWFKGYTDKFFFDKGALFYSVSKKWSIFLCLQFAIRRREMFKNNKTWIEAFHLMLKGIQAIKW